MTDPDRPDPEFDAMTSRLLRREALRRATREINTATTPGLETMLAQISAEVTAEAVNRIVKPPEHPQRSDAPVTRRITSPTSSATSAEPSGPIVTPTGRP